MTLNKNEIKKETNEKKVNNWDIPNLNSYSEKERDSNLFREHLGVIAYTMEQKNIVKMDFIKNSKNFSWLTLRENSENFLTWKWVLKNISKSTKLENIFHLWQKFSISNLKNWETFNIITTEWKNWIIDFFREDRKNLKLENGMIIWEYQEENFSKKDRSEKKENFKNIEISEKDLHDLTALVFAEAHWDFWEKWIAAIIYVILNRKKFWKKSIKQIIFEKWQFSPITDGRFKKFSKSITQKDKDLVRKILNWDIPNPIWNATFFQNKSAESSKWNWQRSASTLAHNKKIIIWNHIFRTEKKFLA